MKTESETGERPIFFFLLSHTPARALRTRKTLTPRFTDFFTDFEEKNDCFVVYKPDGSIKVRKKYSIQKNSPCGFVWHGMA